MRGEISFGSEDAAPRWLLYLSETHGVSPFLPDSGHVPSTDADDPRGDLRSLAKPRSADVLYETRSR